MVLFVIGIIATVVIASIVCSDSGHSFIIDGGHLRRIN